MPQLDSINDFEWRRHVERLDKAVAEAARSYLSQLHARHVSIRTDDWDHELDELRLAREPDCEKPGLPLFYALKHMPRRVISILGLLLSLRLDRYPTKVLDVGSGTGATALALDLINAPRHINLLGLEPSREMIAFSNSSRLQGRVTARYTEGSVSDGVLRSLSLEDFDLLVFSATFPYHFDQWDSLLEALDGHGDNRGRMVLVIEPDAKVDVLDSFARRLRARGWPTTRLSSDDLPEMMKRDDIPLRATQEVWIRIGSPGSTPPRTWWSPPNDRYLIANPQPDWPRLGETRSNRTPYIVSQNVRTSRLAGHILRG